MPRSSETKHCIPAKHVPSALVARWIRRVTAKMSAQRGIVTLATPILAMSLAAATPVWAASNAYTYQVIAKSGDVIGGLTLTHLYTPYLSNDGTVLIVGDIPSAQDGALFSINFESGKKSLLVERGQSIGGYTMGSLTTAARNDNGEIIFGVNLPNGNGIFNLKGPVDLPGQIIGGISQTPVTFTLNNAGEIVFDAVYNNGQNGGIFTPTSVLAKAGTTIGGIKLTNANSPSLSWGGQIAFIGGVPTGSSSVSGIFTLNGLIAKTGDTIGGHTLGGITIPSISKLGLVGFEALDTPEQTSLYYIDHSVAAQSGENIDFLNLQTGGATDGLILNAAGEGLFLSQAINLNGINVLGYFTTKHSVLGEADTVAGLTVLSVNSATMNDAGQVAINVSYQGGTAVIVATPKDGTPLPVGATYMMQDGMGNMIDLGWALNPAWGQGPFAYLYPFDRSTAQQVIFTAAGKLQTVQNPNLYLYNDHGYLALGPDGDTFTIQQAVGAFTIKDGGLYLQSPGKTSPPNKLAFSSKIAYWGLINNSPLPTVLP
jgi:hypothetical protein